MNIDSIKNAFKVNGFTVEKVESLFIGEIIVVVTKDYAKKFTLNFDGNIKLRVIIKKEMFTNMNSLNYPMFFEESNLIEKKMKNHMYINGSICYAPYLRPLAEKWNIYNFVLAVDSVINDYFNKEYLGRSVLNGLEHGNQGLIQYSKMLKERIYK